MFRFHHLAVSVSLLMVGCGSESTSSDDARAATVAALTGDVTAGASVYAANCTNCHGANGKSGSTRKNVASDAAGDRTQAIKKVINGGGGMPVFASLSDQEIADVVAYLASLN